MKIRGKTHICELMHRGGKLNLSGTPGQNDLSIGCTTLELSGTAEMNLQNVHLGRPATWTSDEAVGEANITDGSKLSGNNVSIRDVRFRTRDTGSVSIEGIDKKGKIDIREEGG